MMRKQYDNIKTNQKGIVAIFSAMILMVVISIIVIGFSQVSRSEVKDALNKQLSIQANMLLSRVLTTLILS